MDPDTTPRLQRHTLDSLHLGREVLIDAYLPPAGATTVSLLLVNDGQDLVTMKFQDIIKDLYQQGILAPILCVGLHCSADRKNEYGTARQKDYKGRGAKAQAYERFVLEEVLPFLRTTFASFEFHEKAYAGFSLGGLSAMDIVWNNPVEFARCGVFSGSFWWRSVAQEDPSFNEDLHRIMHQQVRQGLYAPWLRFFFEVGTQDETADRNNNGIIDAIDDTISLIAELQAKGYPAEAIRYVELEDGRHDVATWARAFPDFLLWGWGIRV